MQKNKKIFLIIIFLINIVLSCEFTLGVDNITQKLTEIEKAYYGYVFKDSNESRLKRLEKNVYGDSIGSAKLSQQVRINKLYKDLGMDKNDNNITNKDYDKDNFVSQNQIVDIGPKEDAGIKYPVIDMMEEKLFKKTYITDDIYDRLSRLEKQAFGAQNKSTRSLNERVDALRSKILGGTRTANVDINPLTEDIILEDGQRYLGDFSQDANYNYYSYENSKNHIPNTQSSNDYFNYNGTTDNINDCTSGYDRNKFYNYDLDILEKNLIGKKYTNETSSQRLARLENKVFSRTFNDDDDSRIQRLMAVTTAKKTSDEYDSNKWARRFNAGLQIGGILLMVLAMIL